MPSHAMPRILLLLRRAKRDVCYTVSPKTCIQGMPYFNLPKKIRVPRTDRDLDPLVLRLPVARGCARSAYVYVVQILPWKNVSIVGHAD